MKDESLEFVKRFPTGLFQQLQLISDYSKKVEGMVAAILQKTDREKNIQGLFLRAYCLLTTLYKLDNVKDFQSIAHASRALMEIAVDLILQTHDLSNASLLKIKGWEESAKLAAAEAAFNFYTEKKEKIPSYCKSLVEFIAQNKTRINRTRQSCWPNKSNKPKHPSRWTGRDLSVDVKRADNLVRF